MQGAASCGPAAAAQPSMKCEFIVVDSATATQKGYMECIRALHGGLLSDTFSDLEELEIWEHNLLRPNVPYRGSKHHVTFFVVVALQIPDDDTTSRVLPANIVGGAACDLFLQTAYGMMTYLAVEQRARRHGVTKQLMDVALKHFQVTAEQKLLKPLACFCILVVEARDEHLDVAHPAGSSGYFDPRVRQEIWSRLGFWPIDSGVVMPGRIGAACSQRHQLCILKPLDPMTAPGIAPLVVVDCEEPPAHSVPLHVLSDFVHELFMCILADEGNETDEAGEVEACLARLHEAHKTGRIGIGPSFWH